MSDYRKKKFTKSSKKSPFDKKFPSNPISLDRRTIYENINSRPEWISKLDKNPIKHLIMRCSPITTLNMLKHVYKITHPHPLYELAEKNVFGHLKLKSLISKTLNQYPENNDKDFNRDLKFLSYLQLLHKINDRGGNRHLARVRFHLVEFMKFQNIDGRFPLYYHHHAHALRTLIKLGINGNRNIDRGVNWIVKRQRDDGGWIHRSNVPKGQDYYNVSSCIWTTAEVAALLSEKSGYKKSQELKRACEFLLSKIEHENNSTLLPDQNSWNQFSTTSDSIMMFAGGTLKILEILVKAGYNPSDSRFKKLYEWIISNQMDSGMFPMAASKMPIHSEEVSVRVLALISDIESTRNTDK